MGELEAALRAARDRGRKLLVPYVTGGLGDEWTDVLRAVAAAGADAIEIGIPFSDPVMDGGVIQTASRLALEAGATPANVLETIAEAAIDVPVLVMTYLNPVLAHGEETFLREVVEAGVSGVIVPDLPVDEASGWIEACSDTDVAPVFLAAPGTSDARLRDIAAASRGFVYCVSTMGVTGSRQELSRSAEAVVGGLRPLTDTPLLVGVGISTPAQATAACAFADGVVVGSALVEPMLAGDRDETLTRARTFGAALAFAAAGDQE